MGISGGMAAAVGLGLVGTGAAVNYGVNQYQSSQRQASALLNSPPKAPPPPPAATPATLAQAASTSTKAKATSATTPAKASGTIGAKGPQGLVDPPKTANLSLLGGTR